MKKYKTYIRLTILMVWIVFIFCHSLQTADQSSSQSQWVLELLQKMLPFELSELFIRKMAHFAEFSVLGVLAACFFMKLQKMHFGTGLLSAILVCLGTALCDETIQLFVEGRAGMLQDVWIDLSGAIAGILTMLALQALWNRRTKRS